MQSGSLNQRIRFEAETVGDDGMGGGASSWAEFVTVWGAVRPLSGRERTQADQVEAPANYEFTIRRRSDLTEALRISWAGDLFNIRFIALPDPRSLTMTITAERAVAT